MDCPTTHDCVDCWHHWDFHNTNGCEAPSCHCTEHPPMIGPIVAGELASERLLRQIAWKTGITDTLPTPGQVATVLRSLADHTAIEAARTYSRGEPDEPWPTSLSIGRWLHAIADTLDQAQP